MSTGEDNVKQLRQWLNKEPAHTFNDAEAERAKELLKLAWPEIDGSEETKMAPHKIDRAESMEWDPPNLSFKMERHGGVVHGSVRAYVQLWRVNFESAVASVETVGVRNVRPTAKRFDVTRVARDIVLDVKSRGSDFIKWNKEQTKFQVDYAKLPTELSIGARQTLEGRRKRLKKAIAEELARAGTRYEVKGSWWELTGG